MAWVHSGGRSAMTLLNSREAPHRWHVPGLVGPSGGAICQRWAQPVRGFGLGVRGPSW